MHFFHPILFAVFLTLCLGNLELATEKNTFLHISFPGPLTATYYMLNVPQSDLFLNADGQVVQAGQELPSKDVFFTPDGSDGIVTFVWKYTDDGKDVYSTASISKYSAIFTHTLTANVSPGPNTLLMHAEQSWGLPRYTILELPPSGLLSDGDTDITTVPHTLASDQLVFTPAPSFNCASTSFSYQASDVYSTSEPSTMTLVGTVPPTANQLTFSIPAEDSLEISFVPLQATPTGCPETIHYTIISLPAYGSLLDGSTAISSEALPYKLSGTTATFVGSATDSVSVFSYKAHNSHLSAENSVVVEQYLAAVATSSTVEVVASGAQVTLTASHTAGPVKFTVLNLPSSLRMFRCPATGPCSSKSLGAEIVPESIPLILERNRVFIQPESSHESAQFTFSVSDLRTDSAIGTIYVTVPPA